MPISGCHPQRQPVTPTHSRDGAGSGDRTAAMYAAMYAALYAAMPDDSATTI